MKLNAKTTRKVYVAVVLLLSCVSCTPSAESGKQEGQAERQTDPISDPNQFIGKHKAKVMVLGVFHFDNPGLDAYKPTFPFDILEKKRQGELTMLLDRIAAYKPTKILVEWDRIAADSIANEHYRNYVNGTFSIDDKRNEVYQIGFKLAKRMGHRRIYCSDATAEWFGAALDWDNYDYEAYLKSKGQYEKSTRYDYQAFYRLSDSLKSVQTLTEHLVMVNQPENRLKDHQAYLTELILEGAGDNYVGADAVAKWYRRNLRIFANAYDFVDFDQEERLLLIYGSGHVWQLRQFFTDSPDFEYVELNTYLNK